MAKKSEAAKPTVANDYTEVPDEVVDTDIQDQGTTLGVRETDVTITDPGTTLDS
jgi:hypothetical protein